MEWRCEWCEKPHKENDPPCDNCGHGHFEKAVVQMGPASADDTNPVVWACTECGREHQKHSPPCSRCGNAQLEQREADYSDLDNVESTGWLDILDRKYAAGFAVVGVLGLVLGLGMVGVIDLPGIGGGPAPPTVPGSNASSSSGVAFSDAEAELLATLNSERDDAGLSQVSRGGTLDRMATYFNRRHVEANYGDAEQPAVSELEAYDPRCGRRSSVDVLPYWFIRADGDLDVIPQDSFRNATQMGQTLATNTGVFNEVTPVRGLQSNDRYRSVGIDIHEAPSGDLFVTVVVC